MAADPQPDWLSCLPASWSYGVTRDGRIFFINEEAKSTTWLHPITGEALTTGHRKTPDLPTGWEEGYTFEGARCFINHNERKVTCKHPVTAVPSQDNCIFVVNEQPAPKATSEQGGSRSDRNSRPLSTMSEASNYTGGSDYSTFPGSPTTPVTTTSPSTITSTSSSRPSRSSKKVHNFGKRSNSIKRNPNAPVVKSNWLYKQDSTGMKLWKKRWFVLSDMCLFYYRDEKEDSVLGSILLPSFHVSMLSVDDHVSRKYAFKATHPNMRTYYFCSDTSKEMESWMKVMTDAALVHTVPVRRPDKPKVEQTPKELNNLLNHQVLTRPEVQNNQRNREPQRQQSLSRTDDGWQKDEERANGKEREYYTLQRDGDRFSLKKDGVSYTLQKDGERYLLHKDGEKFLLRRDGEKYCLQKDGDAFTNQRNLEKNNVAPTDEKYAPSKDGQKYLMTKDGEKYALLRMGDRHTLQKDLHKYGSHREVRRQLSLKETERYATMRDTDKYGTVHIMDKYGTLKEVKKYSTLREGNKYATIRDAEKYATLRSGLKCGFQRDTGTDRTQNKISSIKLQPVQAAAIASAIASAVSASRQANLNTPKPIQVSGLGLEVGSGSGPELESGPGSGLGPGLGQGEQHGDSSTTQVLNHSLVGVPVKSPSPEAECSILPRTSSMQQLEHWVRSQRTRIPEDDAHSVTSYQTLPRNMPSHRATAVPRYPDGYRTLPRNSVVRPDSICSVAGSLYDRALRPASTSSVTPADKRRSLRDDTMWQLYEWQQRQAYSRLSPAQPTVGHYGTLPNTKTMVNISEHAVVPSIPGSPSHGGLYSTFSPPRQQAAQHNTGSPHSELGDAMLDRRHRAQLAKFGFPTDRRSVASGGTPQPITAQSLQGKTPEELTLLLIKLRRQQAELNSLREHTVAQLMALGSETPNAKTDVLSHHLQRNLGYLDSQTKDNEPLIFMIHTMIENSAPRPQLYQQVTADDRDGAQVQRTEEEDIDTKLSSLCEQDKSVRMQEEKLQQLHREKHTLETALLSASQELCEQSDSGSAASQNLVQQRDVLQSGLLSTCRELSRVTMELDRSWRDYDRLESDVSLAKSNLLEQLEALGSPQTEPPSQRHIQIQKELWRIQDVMEVLAKNKPERSFSLPDSKPLSSQQKNEVVALLPLSPTEEGSNIPPRPPLPLAYDSSERLPHLLPPQPHSSGRLSTHTHRPDDRKVGPRNGAHAGPDYRLYKSEPELTTVKEEVDEANNEDKEKTGAAESSCKVPPYPVGMVSPRTKPPLSPPESSTIASFVTLRKTRRPEPRLDRPRSAADQLVPGEREIGRTRMSVKEQLDRIRRNQEASSLREKKRESSSNSRAILVPQSRGQAEGACADPLELQVALQQLKVIHLEQEKVQAKVQPAASNRQSAEDLELTPCEKYLQHHHLSLQLETNSPTTEVVILDLDSKPQIVEIVDLQPFEDDESREHDVTSSSPTNTTENSSFQTPEPDTPDTPSPEPKEVTTQREQNLESYRQLTEDDKKLNNNLLTSQTFTLVSSDT